MLNLINRFKILFQSKKKIYIIKVNTNLKRLKKSITYNKVLIIQQYHSYFYFS